MSTNTALDQIKDRVEGHTEGPWEVEEGSDAWAEEGSGAWAVCASGNPITWDSHGGEVFRNQADAELFAAAPKLLAALKAVEALAKSRTRSQHFGGGTSSGIVGADNILETIEEALR